MAERELAARAVGSRDAPCIPEGDGQLQEDRAMHIFMQPMHKYTSLRDSSPVPRAWGACLRRGSPMGTQALLALTGLVNPRPGGAPPRAGHTAFHLLGFEPEGPVVSPEGRELGSCPAPT